MKTLYRLRAFLLLILVLFFIGGCNFKTVKKKQSIADPAIPIEFFINAALYNYFAAECKALAYQAFNSAANYLELTRLKNPERTDLAIVLDIDETLLDNSPYQAQLYAISASYDSLWNYWCNLAAARPVPGAVNFLQFADSLGFHIFYITNRKLKSTYEGTLKNIQNEGFPQADSLHLLMRQEGNSKESRRQQVDDKYEIVMLVGDNIGDFYEDTDNYAVRDSIATTMKSEFGRKLIVLPNAIYGNWISSLGLQKIADLDSLISIMIKPFSN